MKPATRMVRSRQRRRNALSRNSRRPRLESLEDRRLLAVLVDDAYFGPASNEFTVRRDEAEPVELNLNRFYNDNAPIELVASGEGTVEVSNGSKVFYQPEPGFVGVDIFTVRYDRPTADGNEAIAEEVRVAVNVIEPLYAVDDWYHVSADADVLFATLDVLDNDIFNGRYIGANHGSPKLTLQSVRTESNGVVDIDFEEGVLIYTPAPEFVGVDTIYYTAADTDGYTSEGMVQVRVASETNEGLWPEQLQQQLVETAALNNRYTFGIGASSQDYYRYFEEDVFFFAVTDDAALATPDVSGTNNQIAEVDESDRIKTDGEFLYMLSSPDQNDWPGWGIFPFIDFWGGPGLPEPEDNQAENVLIVVDIREPSTPMILSRQIMPDKVLSLDLHGDRLTIISQRDGDTAVATLDVSDANNIQTVSTTVIDGTFKQARRVRDTLYVFTDQHHYGVRNARNQPN